MNAREKIINLGDMLLNTILGTMQQTLEKIKGEILDTFYQIGKVCGSIEANCKDSESLELVGFDKKETATEEAELIVINQGGAK